jgi:hypothetical protein
VLKLRLNCAIIAAFFVIFACSSPLLTITHSFRSGDPIESEADALIAASSALRANFDYFDALTVVSVERMTYRSYAKRFAEPLVGPAGMQVWLVIYFDRAWRVPGPRIPAFPGCMRVVIKASDGSLLKIAGPLRKGMIAKCDH